MTEQTNEERMKIIRENLHKLRNKSRERILKDFKEAENISDPAEKDAKLSLIMKDMGNTLAQEDEWAYYECGPCKD